MCSETLCYQWVKKTTTMERFFLENAVCHGQDVESLGSGGQLCHDFLVQVRFSNDIEVA